jgi:hypothetical protein
MLNVIILNVVLLSVMAPSLRVDCHHGGDAVYRLFGDCRQLPIAIFPADGVVHLKTGERVLGRFRIKFSPKNVISWTDSKTSVIWAVARERVYAYVHVVREIETES